MDRELVLVTLALVTCGATLHATGSITPPVHATAGPHATERRAWTRIWISIVPPLLVLAFLVGWALQEPESSEVAEPALLVAATGFAVVWLRAAIRAVRALRVRPRALAVTSGLLRPRVTIDPVLAATLDDRALRAVEAHEAAHAAHRDPLRVWLAQIVTDLQWPLPAARRRFAAWRAALEVARDAEACETVDGPDLAAALIAVAQLGTHGATAATTALLTDTDRAFADRIQRLLEPPPRERAPRAHLLPLLVAACAAAMVIGALYGESIMQLFPGLD